MTSPLAARLLAAAPLIPDGEQGREWAERELADPVYAKAEPTLVDRIARAILEFFERLFSAQLPAEWGPWLALGAAVIVAALIGLGFAIWGRPRSSARMHGEDDLFGTDERRTASQLRAIAEEHASAGEWDEAIIVRVRALARALSERTIIDSPPGTTVHAFARLAAEAFPRERSALEQTAEAFDDVRYLRRPGSAALYRVIVDVDTATAAAQPAGTAEPFAESTAATFASPA